MFEHGLERMRADFHLHTKKDKEFKYAGAKSVAKNVAMWLLPSRNHSSGLKTISA